jgi:RHS repeat-associated protein
MADGDLDTTEVPSTPSVISPDESPSFSQLAQNIEEGDFSDQGAAYDIQQAIGYYLVDNSANAPLENLDLAQEDLEIALGSQYADVIAGDLAAFAANQLQFDPAVITATSSSAGDPVNLGTGQFVHAATDFTVPGAGISFAFVRTYKSGSYYQGPLGFNWDHSANQWIYLNADGQSLMLQTGELRPIPFSLNSVAGAPYFVAVGDDTIIVASALGSYERRWANGRVDQFDNLTGDGTVYQITSTTDRFGNYIVYTYTQADAQYVLTSVSVNNAQRLVQFQYDDMGRITSISLFNATYWTPAATSLISRQWMYEYDDFGDLVAVTGPATDTFPDGCTTQYQYSSTSSFAFRPHDLTVIVDPNGEAYLENTYGSSEGTQAFGRVIRQRLGDGVYLFDWQQVLPDPDWTFSAADAPSSSVMVVQRNGQAITHVLNAAGNVLLSSEQILAGGSTQTLTWRYAYDGDGRQIAILSPEGRVTQTYYGREYYYDLKYPGTTVDLPLPWQDPKLTLEWRLTFANVLATVKRGAFFDLTTLSDDLAFFGDIFPPATSPNALGGTDAIVKYTYESRFQQRATTSDPRYTASAAPTFTEAPSYGAHLTTVAFNTGPGATPAAVIYPSTTYPDGTPGIANATLTYDLYDADGRLLQYTDPEGNVFAQSYFPADPAQPTLEGFLASQTVGVGTLNLVTSFTVNEAGLVIARTDPLGYTTQYGYDARSLVRVLGLPLPGYTVAATYDGNGQPIATLTAIIAPGGAVAAGSPEVKYVTYNAEGSPLVTSTGDSSGASLREVTQVYDAANCRVRTQFPRGNSVCYEYDERMLVTRVIRGCCDPQASTTTYGYDGDGLQITATDPRGNATRQTLDAFGRAIGILDPVGTLQRIDYDALGNATVRRWFGSAGVAAYVLLRRSEFLFDERGQFVRTRQCVFGAPIATVDPWNAPDAEYNAALGAGAVTFCDSQIFRDGDLRPVLTKDPNGNKTTIAYDSASRRTTVTDPVGSIDGFIYDGNGNVVRRDHCCADATGMLRAVISTGYTYDALNRLSATTDGAGNSTQYALDSRSLLIMQTNGRGDITQWSYSPWRERISETQLLTATGGGASTSLTTTFTFDANSNLTSVRDPLGNTTSNTYDVLDRLVLTTNPDLTSRSTVYDRAGNPIERVDEDGITVLQTFDPANRLTAVNAQYPATPPASAEQALTMTYSGVGDLIAHQNDFVAVTRTCDSIGRCIVESLTLAGPLVGAAPAPLVIGRSYDPASNLTQLNYPSGQELQYAYDAANRLIELQSVANAASYPGDPTAATSRTLQQKQWWADLQIKATLGNGAVLSRSFDAAARRVADTCTLPNGSQTQIQLLWDAASNRAVSVNDNAGNMTGWLYGYDSTERLTSVAQIQGPTRFATGGIAPPTARPVVWKPNAQTTIDALIGGYVSFSPLQSQYIYDDVGNRAQVDTGTSTTNYLANVRNEYTNVGGMSFIYTPAGRLSSNGRVKCQYNFRGQLAQASTGRRITVQVFHDALGRPIAAFERGRTRVLVPDGANAIEFYDRGALSAVNVFEGRDRLFFFASGRRDQYVMRDIVESTRLTSDGRGRSTAYCDYDAFGTLLGVAPATELRYAGKYVYAALHWYEFQLRQYVPVLGRFAQPDPAGFVDGTNLFTFLANNPLSARDPDGTDGRDIDTEATPVRPAGPTGADNAAGSPPLVSASDDTSTGQTPATTAASTSDAPLDAAYEGPTISAVSPDEVWRRDFADLLKLRLDPKLAGRLVGFDPFGGLGRASVATLYGLVKYYGRDLWVNIYKWAADDPDPILPLSSGGAIYESDEKLGADALGSFAELGLIAAGGVEGLDAAGAPGPGLEFSHWIPNRWGGPRSLWNGNFVSTVEHALSDPYRYRFMSGAWKALNPPADFLSSMWNRIPLVYKGAAAGSVPGAAAAAANAASNDDQ